MKTLLFALLLVSTVSFAMTEDEIPFQPPSPCYGGCTDNMTAILEKFEKASAPALTPGAYSGGCYHKSRDYNPDHLHYAATLIDLNDLNEMKPYLSTIFYFFYESDEAADWDLHRMRKEMSDEWKTSERVLSVNEGTARTIIWSEGAPAYIYWLRQNPVDGTLYMITYWGGTYIKSFCELKKH